MTDGEPAGGIGDAVTRREDRAALTGTLQFVDDLDAPGLVHLAFVRSPYGHAAVRGIDASAVAARADVLGVYTAADVAAFDGGPLGRIPLKAPPFPDAPYPPDAIRQPVIAADRVVHHGEVVAAVVATDRYAAHDAAEAVAVDYDRLETVVTPAEALADGAPTIHDACPDNVAFEGRTGDEAAVEAAFDGADHVVRLDKPLQRLAPTPLEPRGVLASFDRASGRLTVRPTTQIPHGFRRHLAEVLSFPANRLDVVAPAMGGGFGARQHPYPEDVLAAWCAVELGRPVKWRATRVENGGTETDGRGFEGTWSMAVDGGGRIQALRADIRYDLGAWIAEAGPVLANTAVNVMTGAYDVPAAHCRIRGVLTNTSRVDAYRGVTEADMTLMLERLVDRAARATGLDPAEVRRRNVVPPDRFPNYETATGAVIDSGDYAATLDLALERAGYDDLRARQRRLRESGRHLGIGVATWVETAGLGPCGTTDVPTWGYSRVQVHASGAVTVAVGSSNHGQGHETTLAQVAADRLGLPFDDVVVVQNDTTRVPEGVGTYASRTAPVEGGAIVRAATRVLEKARRIAAHHLEVAPDDVAYEAGRFHVAGAPDRTISFAAVARHAVEGRDLPADLEPGLEAHAYFDPAGLTWPFGTHVAVVEVDPETGAVAFEDYVVAEDCGPRINPMVVEGQIHGGTAQGIGQALFESVGYDDNGTPTTASLQDYALPRAAWLPDLRIDHQETPSPNNPLGVKGMAESGAIAAPAAVVNAIEDALRPFDAPPLALPATPERVWRAAHGAGAPGAAARQSSSRL